MNLKTVQIKTAIPGSSTDEARTAIVTLPAAPWDVGDTARTFNAANVRALLEGNPMPTSSIAEWFCMPFSSAETQLHKIALRGLLDTRIGETGKRIWVAK